MQFGGMSVEAIIGKELLLMNGPLLHVDLPFCSYLIALSAKILFLAYFILPSNIIRLKFYFLALMSIGPEHSIAFPDTSKWT